MTALWIWLGLGLLPTAQAQDAPRSSWFKNIRYGVGAGVQLGADTLGTPLGDSFVVEPANFEFRSYFTPNFAWHTSINVFRMVAPAVGGEGRLDYDLHIAAHLPVDERTEVVIAPGASIGYAFDGGYQRFAGDFRIGVDLHDVSRWFTWGLYARPIIGWGRPSGGGPDDGYLVLGGLVEAVFIAHIRRKGERGQAVR